VKPAEEKEPQVLERERGKERTAKCSADEIDKSENRNTIAIRSVADVLKGKAKRRGKTKPNKEEQAMEQKQKTDHAGGRDIVGLGKGCHQLLARQRANRHSGVRREVLQGVSQRPDGHVGVVNGRVQSGQLERRVQERVAFGQTSQKAVPGGAREGAVIDADEAAEIVLLGLVVFDTLEKKSKREQEERRRKKGTKMKQEPRESWAKRETLVQMEVPKKK
jgi:hypothetical protein